MQFFVANFFMNSGSCFCARMPQQIKKMTVPRLNELSKWAFNMWLWAVLNL